MRLDESTRNTCCGSLWNSGCETTLILGRLSFPIEIAVITRLSHTASKRSFDRRRDARTSYSPRCWAVGFLTASLCDTRPFQAFRNFGRKYFGAIWSWLGSYRCATINISWPIGLHEEEQMIALAADAAGTEPQSKRRTLAISPTLTASDLDPSTVSCWLAPKLKNIGSGSPKYVQPRTRNTIHMRPLGILQSLVHGMKYSTFQQRKVEDM